jgi:uncharacterized protein YkwD
MKIKTINLSQDQINEITQHVNSYRNKHHVNNLTYDPIISNTSQNWASYLSVRNEFKHSNNRQYGENLSWYGGYKNEIVKLIKLSVDKWYNEIKQYNFNNPTFSSQTGHATALLWSSSTSFGFGYSYNNSKKSAIVVMNFNPPGNVMGQFKENVLPM